MILIIYGTTGELIKLAPVLKRLEARGHRYITATTGQQAEQIPVLLDSLGLPPPDFWLARGRAGHDLRANGDVPKWLHDTWSGFVRSRRSLLERLRSGPGRPLTLVHGDTMTTLLGSLMGRALMSPVAHIESGLRSFDLFHPFPEEINRRLTSRVAALLYAPGDWAASNLKRGDIVNTGSNTIRDSLELCGTANVAMPGLENGYGIVSLHRFELLNDRGLLERTLRLIADEGRRRPLIFIDHPVTVSAIAKLGLGHVLEKNVRRMPRLNFVDFIPLLRTATFLFSDSGGNQEETYYLDIPCLIHRKRTERREGLGENVCLSGYDMDTVNRFLSDPGNWHRKSGLPSASPSDVIVEDLAARGFAATELRR